MSIRGTSILAIVGLLSASIAAFASPTDPDYSKGRELWERRDYPGSYERLSAFRTKPYGRRADVDYMLATSACRIRGLETWGRAMLEWLPYCYPLSGEDIEIVREALRSIGGAAPVAAGIPSASIPSGIVAGLKGTAKTYWAFGEVENGSPIRTVEDIPPDVLEGRRANRGSTADPAKWLEAKRPLPDATYASSPRLIIADARRKGGEELAEAADFLERFISCMERQYSIPEPLDFITIYLFPDARSLQRFASDFHGLMTDGSILGYCFPEDMSVVAAVPGSQYGTLLHELCHLLVRRDFGDIPQWLDEGVASLYESATMAEGEARGTANWRVQILRQCWKDRPKLSELIASDWFGDEAPERSSDLFHPSPRAEERAVYMATARSLFLYLQAKGRIPALYAAFRDRDPASLDPDPKKGSVKLAEKALGLGIDALEEDFKRWFMRLYPPIGR